MLEAYDFRDYFSIHEIACLAIGLDPTTKGPIESGPYVEIARAAEYSATIASSECAIRFLDGGTQQDLPRGVLYPRWALNRIPMNQEWGAAIPVVNREHWPEDGFDPGPKESWRFAREVVAAWFAGRAFRPVYEFSRPGGTFPPSEREPDRELGTNERDTLLRILYGMAVSEPYRYDPAAAKNEATAIIASATAAAGCSVSLDTIRARLKEASEKFGPVHRLVDGVNQHGR